MSKHEVSGNTRPLLCIRAGQHVAKGIPSSVKEGACISVDRFLEQSVIEEAKWDELLLSQELDFSMFLQLFPQLQNC